MYSVLKSYGLNGLNGFAVAVEADVSGGLPAFSLVGLPDSAVRESGDRVRSAVKNLGYKWPDRHITVNLAPADIRKSGPVYDLPLLLAVLASSGQIPKGAFWLCLTGLICALTDIFAYLVGSRYGKHKLAYKVSPGKSVEGALGGLAASVVIAAVTAGPVFGNVGTVAVYAAVASILGQWGDLSMSAVKRVAGVKDFGKIFPGHGGILDRCDSLMYPLAATWLLYGLMK